MVTLGWRAARLGLAVVLGLGVGLAGGTGRAAPNAGDQGSSVDVIHVELSEFSPNAIHYPDGSWAIPLPSRDGQGHPGQPAEFLCRGTYINPEIVARGRGTAVHFAAKFFCNRPVGYSVTVGVTDFYENTPGGPVVAHPGGQITRGGLSATPYVEGFSPPCKNNLNSGWEPYDNSKIEGDAHNGRGTRVTVGCRV